MSDCIFCRIVKGEIPAKRVYEDELLLAFHDIAPIAPLHVLVIPKQHLASLAETGQDDAPLLGQLMVKAGQIARSLGFDDGFRLIANTGRVGGQEVAHLHLHILSGDEPLGPMLKRRGIATDQV